MLKVIISKIMRRSLKNAVVRSEFLHGLFCSYELKKYENGLLKKSLDSELINFFLTRKEVVEEITLRKVERGSDVCHVIGSGWSLNQSISKIDEGDFVIGFNYAGIADIDFDVYFFEFGGGKVSEISRNHLAIARKKIIGTTNLIYFKNIWEDKNDIDFIASQWLEFARPVKDHPYTVLDKRHLRKTLSQCLGDETDYIPQLRSTVVTATILAFQAGFRKIVIHGLDFGGQYFYECMDRETDISFLPPPKPVSGFYGKTNKDNVHPTAASHIGMRDIILEIYGLLKERDTVLMCGSANSPSSQYLPVYE